MKVARLITAALGAAVLLSSAATPALASTKSDGDHKKHAQAVASSGTPPWAACAAIGQDPQKIIKTYTRTDFQLPQNGGPALNRGSSTLRCGTTGWGYVHIKKFHMNTSQPGRDSWQHLADMTDDQQWMDVAHQGLLRTIQNPDKVTWSSSRETWCLSAKVSFYEGSDYITSHFVQTILGKDTNIVSTYPADKQCENNSHD